ncbi:GtrA family protein [Rhizobium leucaenae]|uniref:Putative flippase GtrA n=1 Tax=Rhizobium leucaenae TaxID=29450 RepID=A0A7W6ZZJ2_9HYPH|nr:GtrA family protein [Rhizobium leucaenae]MBB4571688.1 putative flippase GtrA [Rhizobium leucaenae]
MIATIWQGIRFGVVGLANTSIGLLTIYATIYFLGSPPLAANAIGYAIGFAISFVLNRRWTFEDTLSISHVLPRYFLAAASSYILNFIAVFICLHYFNVNPYFSQLVGIALYTISMFFISKFFVFTKSQNDCDGLI